MTKNRIKKVVKYSSQTDAPMSIKNSLITIGVFLLICVGMYYLTELIINRQANSNSDSKSSSEITFDYSKILFDNILTRPYSEYYVLAVDFSNTTIYGEYTDLVTTYEKSSKSKKVYYVNISDSLNKNHVSDKSNLDVTDIADLKVSKTTLIYIKNGMISKSYENATKIKELLK